MKYVVTGGAGFIGSHIVEGLLQLGADEICVIDDLSDGKVSNIPKDSRVRFVKGDICDLDLLKREFKGVEGVFHHAALVEVSKSVEFPLETDENNIRGTLNVLLAARDNGVRKVVFASSCAVYGNKEGEASEKDFLCPLSPYAMSKLAGEHYCRLFYELYGLKTVALRYFNVFGERQALKGGDAAAVPAFMNAVKKGKGLLIYGTGEQTRDFVYVKDVVQANLKAMESDKVGVFNVGSGRASSVLEVVAAVNKVIGKNVQPAFEAAREGDVMHISGNILKAQKLLGFKPQFGLESGLQRMIEVKGK